jgi:HSP20 family protein
MSTLLMEPLAPWLRDLGRQFGGGGAGPAPFFPPADVIVTDADVTVHLDVPGVPADRVDVELERDVLSIRGERPYPYAEDEGGGGGQTWRRIERGFGRFERVVRVPHGLDPDAVEAALQDGVLTLRIRKPEPERPHRIEIRATNGGRTIEAGTGSGAGSGAGSSAGTGAGSSTGAGASTGAGSGGGGGGS